MTQYQRQALIGLLAVGLVGAMWLASLRISNESANAHVGLCVDYREAERLAALTGRSMDEMLAELKNAGATHVALVETTLGDLILSGRVKITHSFGQTRLYGLGRGGYTKALEVRLPGLAPEDEQTATRPDGPGPGRPAGMGTFDGDITAFRDVGVGYDPIAQFFIKESGLELVARPVADFCLSAEAVDQSLQFALDAGSKLLVFNGIRILGTPGLLVHTADWLQQHDVDFGMIELVPQAGEQTLAGALESRVIRTHSVSAEEMEILSPSRVRERFVLAVSERKVRLCYVRLFFRGAQDLSKLNLDHVGGIAGSLQQRGYTLASPRPFEDLIVPSAAVIWMALGVLGGLLWLLQLLAELPARAFWTVAGIGLLLAIAVPAAAPGMAPPLIGLAAALIFPLLALCLIPPVYPEPDDERRGQKPLVAAGLVARTSLVTAIGGLLCAGALTAPAYLMKIEQFRGVKIAQLLPLLVVLLIFAARATESYRNAFGSGPRWQALLAGLSEVGSAVVRYWHVLAIVLGLGVVGYMLMRSGNQPSMGASGLELQVRSLLDRLLVVRPRTKEIMLGYPALFIGITLLLHRRFRVYWVFVAVGAISQVSLFNTFCHMHTPLAVSLVRVIHGLWLGLLMGLVWWALKRAAESIWAARTPN